MKTYVLKIQIDDKKKLTFMENYLEDFHYKSVKAYS